MKFETDYIEKLAKIISETGLTEISLEDGEQAITLRKDVIVSAAPQVVAAAPSAPASAPSAQPAASAPAVPAKKVLQLHLQWLEPSTNHHLRMQLLLCLLVIL